MRNLSLMPAAAAIAGLVSIAAADAQEFLSPRDLFMSTCIARWTRADINGDGWLDKDEIENAGRLMPSSIQSPASVSARQFIDACVRQLQEQQARR